MPWRRIPAIVRFRCGRIEWFLQDIDKRIMLQPPRLLFIVYHDSRPPPTMNIACAEGTCQRAASWMMRGRGGAGLAYGLRLKCRISYSIHIVVSIGIQIFMIFSCTLKLLVDSVIQCKEAWNILWTVGCVIYVARCCINKACRR